ncbi:LEAF RUST 10 DISEASE-RESISTANCE LOCUS RECEPTOR-LIKE PROTEIN KINASE-like 1.4, partial [Mucuna pruriens]
TRLALEEDRVINYLLAICNRAKCQILFLSSLLKMQLLQAIFFSFLVITIILNQIPISSCADNVHYLRCSSSFQCANLKNLSYPFWGFSRPQYCGHPAFKLQCTGEVAAVTIMSESYKVLEVSDSNHRLKVVRTEVLETNSTVENLKDSLDSGFGVEWDANNSLCDECQNSGGHCGYNVSSSEFSCYCRDGSFPSSCKSDKETPTNKQQTMLFIWSANIIIAILITSLHHTTSLPPHASLSSCHVSSFNCGAITNLSYPFTGGDRPSFCGPPQFHLNCQNGVVPELNISSVSYRVIGINSVARTLTLARLDLWNETCTHVYVNSTFDDPSFSYGLGNQNLTLFYECKPTSAFTKTPANLFHCESNGYKNNSYSLVGPFPLDPIIGVVECDEHVEVPIFVEQAERLIENRSLLEEVLMKGFNVNYTNIYDSECVECLGSGGYCGFDSDNNEPICICGDHLCPTPDKRSSKVGVVIGVTVGGVVVLVAILGCVYFVMQRRRKIAYKSQRSSELFMAPLSGDTFTSTTNTSQSVSSYQSSKSDIVQPRSYYFGVQVFTYDELEEATKNFDPSRELGEGGFGTVYKGELKDGRIVAVKRHYESNARRIAQFMNEVQILARLRHKNLVTLFGCTSKHSRELLLVYEFIPNGTLADHLQERSSKSNLLPWPIRLNIAVETAEALAYLHAQDVIHRDVKTNNILLDDKFRVKVADFGLSRDFPKDVTHVSTVPQGTPGYVDPEYYKCYQLTDKSDVYSFGVVLVELISSLQAVDINRHRNDVNLASMAVNKIQNQELHELVDPYLGFERDNAIRRMTTAVAELAFRCLQPEREIRPSMDEVLEILRGIKSDDLGARAETEVLEVRTDEVRLLKLVPSPFSPDSVVDKWVSGSSVSNSS